MTIGTITEHGEPNPELERDDPTLQAQAVTGLTTPADAGLQVQATVALNHAIRALFSTTT
jgi:hypothetical protein